MIKMFLLCFSFVNINYYNLFPFLRLELTRWFSPDNPVSSTNKTDRHDITEILLKVALNTINRLDYMRNESCLTMLTTVFVLFCFFLLVFVFCFFSFCGVRFLCCVFFCIFCLRPVSCVPNVAHVSGLLILDYRFGFL